jgi:hypothetical protein
MPIDGMMTRSASRRLRQIAGIIDNGLLVDKVLAHRT